MSAGRNSRIGGFTLIEVLVAVTILAVGLLGLAGLQIAGMKANRSAQLRTQATFAAYDLMDRMRANPTEFLDQSLESDDADEGTSPAFFAWAEYVEGTLGLPPPADGSARGAVDCGAGNACGPGSCEVIIRWDDSRSEARHAVWVQPWFDPLSLLVSNAYARDLTTLTFRLCSRLPQ